MYEILKDAVPQAPALVVLVVLVFAFLKFLKAERDSLQDMADAGTKVIDRNTEALEDNTLIQGQVLEALRRSNGHTTIEPVQHIEANEAENAG